MRSRVPVTVVMLTAAVGSLVHASLGCGRVLPSEQDDCSCFPPTLTIEAPVGEVQAIAVSGACAGAKVICVSGTAVPADGTFVPGCEAYAFAPTGAGECAVHVSTKSLGTHHETRTIEDDTQSCCGGYYVTPLSASRIEIPDAGDAGDADGA